MFRYRFDERTASRQGVVQWDLKMRRVIGIAISPLLALALQGCLAAEADVKLVIRDQKTGEELKDCYLAIEQESQTTIGTLFTQMPRNLGRDRTVDIRRVDSGYRYKLDDLRGYYVFLGVVYTVTDSKWHYYLFRDGYVPVSLAAKDLLKPEQKGDQFVVEMKRYVPGRSSAEDAELFDAGNTACWYRDHVAWGDHKAKPVWSLLAQMTEASLAAFPSPGHWWGQGEAQAPPADWWTRERVEALAKELRSFNTE